MIIPATSWLRAPMIALTSGSKRAVLKAFPSLPEIGKGHAEQGRTWPTRTGGPGSPHRRNEGPSERKPLRQWAPCAESIGPLGEEAHEVIAGVAGVFEQDSGHLHHLPAIAFRGNCGSRSGRRRTAVGTVGTADSSKGRASRRVARLASVSSELSKAFTGQIAAWFPRL